jgi:SOS response regulatory protein OraA/RecX
MKNINNMTAEELIEYLSKTDLSSEEIKKICREWLKHNYMDDWLCE